VFKLDLKFQVRASIFKKDKNVFQEVFKNIPTVNWCTIMNGKSKLSSNILIKILCMIVKEKYPELHRKCPLGPLILEKLNITMDRRIVAMFPSGFYRFDVDAKNKKEEELIFKFSLLIEIIS
jgi:hypothetical protein